MSEDAPFSAELDMQLTPRRLFGVIIVYSIYSAGSHLLTWLTTSPEMSDVTKRAIQRAITTGCLITYASR